MNEKENCKVVFKCHAYYLNWFQGDVVRDLKAAGALELDVKKAVNELKLRKKILEDKELELRSETFSFVFEESWFNTFELNLSVMQTNSCS